MSVTAIADTSMPTLRERIEARRVIESIALHEALDAMQKQGADAASAVLARYAPAYETLVDPSLLVDEEPPEEDLVALTDGDIVEALGTRPEDFPPVEAVPALPVMDRAKIGRLPQDRRPKARSPRAPRSD